jgi:surface protein
MKSINQYINEKLILSKTKYNYHPQTKEELKDLMKQLIEERGYEGDFNDIDTSKIKDMRDLIPPRFNGDISKWNVSNVTDMESMFEDCTKFNVDLSEWDVSNVENMSWMFSNCNTFEGKGLENWDVSNVTNMKRMFANCDNLDIDKTFDWNPIKMVNMERMFVNVKKQFTKIPDWILL